MLSIFFLSPPSLSALITSITDDLPGAFCFVNNHPCLSNVDNQGNQELSPKYQEYHLIIRKTDYFRTRRDFRSQYNSTPLQLSGRKQVFSPKAVSLIISANSISRLLVVELSQLSLPCKIVRHNSPCYCHLLTG